MKDGFSFIIKDFLTKNNTVNMTSIRLWKPTDKLHLVLTLFVDEFFIMWNFKKIVRWIFLFSFVSSFYEQASNFGIYFPKVTWVF